MAKKTAPAAKAAAPAKKAEPKAKAENPLFPKRPKNLRIGGDVRVCCPPPPPSQPTTPDTSATQPTPPHGEAVARPRRPFIWHKCPLFGARARRDATPVAMCLWRSRWHVHRCPHTWPCASCVAVPNPPR